MTGSAGRDRAIDRAWSNPRTPQSVWDAIDQDEQDEDWKNYYEKHRKQRQTQRLVRRRTF